MKNPNDTMYNMIMDNLSLSSNMIYNPIHNIADRIASERAERLDALVMSAFPRWSRKVKSKIILKVVAKWQGIEIRYISHNKVQVLKGGSLFGEIEYNK